MANKLGYSAPSRVHHYKELGVRLLLGAGLGHMLGLGIYGKKEPEIDPELMRDPVLAEKVEDKDSLHYSEFVKRKQNRDDFDFIRPGKIKD